MSHESPSSHTDYAIRPGDRGWLVLPAEVRRALELEPEDELVARLEGDGLRVVEEVSSSRP